MYTNILTKLRLELDNDEINYKKASALQGVLFENMNKEYALKMHEQQIHPYSQYIVKESGKTVWYINTLCNEARENIIEPLLKNSFNGFHLKHGDLEIRVTNKSVVDKDFAELMNVFYNTSSSRNICIELKSLTSFKQRGRYNIVPNLRLMYQSLMMKYSAVVDSDMFDEETLEQLEDNSLISKYNLRSGLFPMEGQKIPGYMGTLNIQLFGPETLRRYVKMLMQFGEFSGMGIKTGMGMGAISIVEEQNA